MRHIIEAARFYAQHYTTLLVQAIANPQTAQPQLSQSHMLYVPRVAYAPQYRLRTNHPTLPQTSAILYLHNALSSAYSSIAQDVEVLRDTQGMKHVVLWTHYARPDDIAFCSHAEQILATAFSLLKQDDAAGHELITNTFKKSIEKKFYDSFDPVHVIGSYASGIISLEI